MQRVLLTEVAAGADARVVLELVIDLIESQAPGAIASVLLVDRETQTLHTYVAPRLPESYNAAVDGVPITVTAGSCGTAAATKQTVVVEDIRRDPLWADYADVAEAHGLRACWSTPIIDADGDVTGTFALYYGVPRRPTERELEVVEMAAGVASIVFEREAAAGERRELDRRYRTLVEQLPLVIYVDALDATSSNIFTSRQIEGLLGYSVAEWRDDGDLFVKLLHPEDKARVLEAHEHTHATHEPLSTEYRLKARGGRYVESGRRRRVVEDKDGSPMYLQVTCSTSRRSARRKRRSAVQALYDPLTGSRIAPTSTTVSAARSPRSASRAS